MGKSNWTGRFAAAIGVAAGALAASPMTLGQTTALSETWQSGSVGIINPLGGALSLGDNFSGDLTWTVVTPTQDAGTGPHMRHELVDFGGSRWLAWQNDGVENAIDTQLFYEAPVAVPFQLGSVQTATFSFDIVPTIIATGGRRSATFYIGQDTNTCYRFQINMRAGASELIEVASIHGLVNAPVVFGDPSNFDPGAVEVGNVYTFTAVIIPGATETTIQVSLRDSANNVIEGGPAVFNSTDMLPLSTNIDFFALRGRQRTYQLWDNLNLEFTTPTPAEPGNQPVITPNGFPLQVGDAVILSTQSGGTGYQWYRNGVAMTNGPRISGATTNVLTITPAEEGDTATYTVEFNDGVDNVESLPYNLIIFPAGALPVMSWVGMATLGLLLVSVLTLYVRRQRRA